VHVDESSLPSSSTIMKSLQKGFDGETYDRDYPQRLKETIYSPARANAVRQAPLPLLAPNRRHLKRRGVRF